MTGYTTWERYSRGEPARTPEEAGRYSEYAAAGHRAYVTEIDPALEPGRGPLQALHSPRSAA